MMPYKCHISLILGYLLALFLTGCQGYLSSFSPNTRVETIQYPETSNAAVPSGIKIYDNIAISEIEKQWQKILNRAITGTNAQSGEVVISFELHSDGSISDTRVVKSNVNEKETEICRMAISNAAPFRAWPEKMKEIVVKGTGLDHRDLQFNFRYKE